MRKDDSAEESWTEEGLLELFDIVHSLILQKKGTKWSPYIWMSVVTYKNAQVAFSTGGRRKKDASKRTLSAVNLFMLALISNAHK